MMTGISHWAGASILLLSSCAAAGAGETPRGSPLWCFAERPPGKSEPLSAAAVLPVKKSQIARGLEALSERTFVPLDEATAAAYLGANQRAAEGRPFLVRGSVFAPQGASLDELDRLARSARFEVTRFSGNRIGMVTMQPGEGVPTRATNFPLVLRTNNPVAHVFVACFSVP